VTPADRDTGEGRGGPIRAAGGLLWREVDGVRCLAVIHRPRYGDWSLPKGKLERGESFEAAALREVEEETGCRARLGGLAGRLEYEVRGRPKVVVFWHMFAESAKAFRPNDEVDRLEWLPPQAAIARLDQEGERCLVEAALAGAGRSPPG
jgi:8-oxo-dGTP pyrophosphatase MutT (NUDIX family)